MSRDDLFKQGLNNYKKEREDKESKKNFKFTPTDYTALETGKVKIVRLLGLPITVKENETDPFSPKLVTHSQILDDMDKKMRVIWPTKGKDDSWILWKILNLVEDYTWDSANDCKIYKNQQKYPTVFNRVHKNNNIKESRETGWRPKNFVVFNVIDRDLMDWHRDNKKTILLSKKASGEEGHYFFEPGIPSSCYSLIMDNIIEFYGPNWENYDVGFEKLNDDPWYRVWHIEKDREKLSRIDSRFGENSSYFDYCNKALTEEELSWERINISNIFKVTSYYKIQKRLGNFIKLVDNTFKKNFSEELEVLVEKEKKEFESRNNFDGQEVIDYIDKKENEERKSFPVEKDLNTSTMATPDVSHHVDGNVGIRTSVSSELKDDSKPIQVTGTDQIKDVLINIANKKITGEKKEGKGLYYRLMGINNLTEKEIKSIESMIYLKDLSTLKFEYTRDSGQIYQCPECKFLSPFSFQHCPDCGHKF